ncbi:MAG: CRTAC1 family protein [bacterium]|nr:CRTAC1 family protein [bacterium]
MKRLACCLMLAGFTAGGQTIRYENIAAKAGLTDVFPNGGADTKRYIIETTGGGAGLIDFDNDGLLDAFVTSGEGSTNRLYHNEGNDRFVDITEEAGLTSSGWQKGVCASDYDNDGFTDLMVTNYGAITLYRNTDGLHFDDVTKEAGLEQKRLRYNSGCAFLDYDRDGHIDLLVANYLKHSAAAAFEPGSNPYCFYRGMAVNCGPRGLDFDANILYRNNGDGTFANVSEESGIAQYNQNYPLGVLTGDFDQDGWPDIYVACDVTPGLLFMNQRDGTFEDEALLRGAALDENGKALSGMGVTAGDFDGDGWLDIFRTNFSDERDTLYRNLGDGDFEDQTVLAGLGRNTRFVSWGCGFLDFDLDRDQDLLIVSGHVFPEVDSLNIDVRARDRRILFRNDGQGGFADISEQAGPAIQERFSSRGVAFGDIDNDGSVEILVNNQNDPPSLLKLADKPAGNWVLLQLEGAKSNRSAIGARVHLTAGGRTQVGEVRSGGSYISQSDLRLHFGLGDASVIEKIEIHWPSGAQQVVTGAAINEVVRIEERP